MTKVDAPPDCPHCQEPMRLAHVVPGAFGHPELHSFECRACHEAVTLEVAPEQGIALMLLTVADAEQFGACNPAITEKARNSFSPEERPSKNS